MDYSPQIFLIIFAVALAASFFAVPLFLKISTKYHLYDNPGNDLLKIHKKPIPYVGGLGIFAGFFLGLLLAWFMGVIRLNMLYAILGGGVVVLLWGFWDDWKWKKDFRTSEKLVTLLIISFFAAVVIGFAGMNFSSQSMAALTILLAMLYIAGAMTSINMEDGIDGLAAGLATVSLVGFSILSMAHQSAFSFAVSLATLGGVAGFLFFNWNPASVFMGDSGSHFLGFVLAALAIGFSADPFQNIGHFVGPIMIIGLPVFDTALAIWRRISKDRSPFLGDREHLYDKLMHHGFSVKETVMVCCVIHAIIVGIGIGIYL